jgi:hypothetical protein
MGRRRRRRRRRGRRRGGRGVLVETEQLWRCGTRHRTVALSIVTMAFGDSSSKKLSVMPKSVAACASVAQHDTRASILADQLAGSSY